MHSVGVPAIDAVIEEAVGRRHRPDPVTGRSSGPAGNAELTAWTGLLLLVLIVVELVTLLDVRACSAGTSSSACCSPRSRP